MAIIIAIPSTEQGSTMKSKTSCWVFCLSGDKDFPGCPVLPMSLRGTEDSILCFVIIGSIQKTDFVCRS